MKFDGTTDSGTVIAGVPDPDDMWSRFAAWNEFSLSLVDTNTEEGPIKSRFEGNVATKEGGAIALGERAEAHLHEVVFEKNSAAGEPSEDGGGGAVVLGKEAKLDATECDFLENTATENSGGAIKAGYGSEVNIKDSTATGKMC